MQHWMISETGVVVVVEDAVSLVLDVVVAVVVVLVTPTQALGAQTPSPMRVPPIAMHSSGLRSSHARNDPPGEVDRQHWVSCGTSCAGKQPRASASHALVKLATHAVPPRGALHLEAGRMEHFVRPRRFVLQQVTVPVRPQVERPAQLRTWCRCFLVSPPVVASAFRVRFAHLR